MASTLTEPAPAPVGVADADGRRRRGDASRRQILDAATRLIAGDGVATLTHRSVAAEAGVSVARVAYHFPTVDDLLLSAAADYLRAFDERLRSLAERTLAGEGTLVDVCTDVVHDLVTTRAREFLGMLEVRLVLARRGRSVDDLGIVALIGSFGADQPRAGAIAAAMFGFAVVAASGPSPVSRAQVEEHVRTVLGALA